MKFTKLNRTIHNWISIFIALPILLLIVSGLFLQLKKDISWIQPPSVRGEVLLASATSVPQTAGLKWSEFERIDYKVDRGMVKFMTFEGWEVQVDTTNGAILSVAQRRSDFFEKLHDGTYIGDWFKYYVVLPSAVCLFILWLTGLYMFIYPYFKRASNRRNKKLKAQAKAQAKAQTRAQVQKS